MYVRTELIKKHPQIKDDPQSETPWGGIKVLGQRITYKLSTRDQLRPRSLTDQ